MFIDKKYIEENLINKRGTLNGNLTRKIPLSNEELYIIYYELKSLPLCLGAKRIPFKNFTAGYKNPTCGSKECICYKDKYKRIQKTMRETNLKKYGVESTLSVKEIRDKQQKTKLEKYGNPFFNNSDKTRETWKNKAPEEIKKLVDKVKKTKLERYGDENYVNLEKAQKTKLEKYGNPFFNNTEKCQANKRKTMESRGLWVPLEDRTDWDYYKIIVRRLTEITYKKYKNEINPLGLDRVLNGKDGYQLDHIISTKKGFENNILPHIIASKENLQMLEWKKNRDKWY